jgi:hypothetical protein
MLRRPAPPLWFLLCVVVVSGLLLRAFLGEDAFVAPSDGHLPQVQLGFWGFLILVGQLIWKGLEIAGRVTLEVLKWMVVNLSLVVTKLGNGLKALGQALLLGLQKSWKFFELTYEKVLKPAWGKFWSWFDKFRRWLDRTIGPVLKWLRRLRDNLLKFWKEYVRPWLDLIDVTRRALRILNSLGLRWAGALDRRLGEIEEAIERPFRLLLAKVNEVITIVNRIMTADGLFQRLTLLRTLARDYGEIGKAIADRFSRRLTDEEERVYKAPFKPKTDATHLAELRVAITDADGPLGSRGVEFAADVRLRLARPR